MKVRTALAYVLREGTTQGELGQRSERRCSKAMCGVAPAAATASSQAWTFAGSDVAASQGTVSRA